jgi:hypothetical protein
VFLPVFCRFLGWGLLRMLESIPVDYGISQAGGIFLGCGIPMASGSGEGGAEKSPTIPMGILIAVERGVFVNGTTQFS